MSMTYSEVVEYIINVPRFNKYIDSSLAANETLLALMNALGNPHLKVKTIHIAGTNGKGSTVQLIKNILVESGYKVGCFVSPHLVKINERISIWECLKVNPSDAYISDQDFLKAFDVVESAYSGLKVSNKNLPSLTFFEYVFAIAAVYFQDKNLDYCIYETGLGGRLDATNILKPVITVITSIGLDHMKLLGNTIEEIAAEKAGIIKPGVPIVYNTGDELADIVIKNRALKLNADEYNVAKAQYIINDFGPRGIDFSCSNSYYRYQNIYISSQGIYQVNNALTAIEVCNSLPDVKVPIEPHIIKSACEKFFWQGRMEQLSHNLIVDGAHNLDAIVQFVKSLNARYETKGINILFAVADDKNYKDMIEYLCANLNLENVYVTAIESDRRVLAREIALLFQEFMSIKLCKPVELVDITMMDERLDIDKERIIFYHNDLEVVFNKAYSKIKEVDDILFCVGSLYLIGDIKKLYTRDFI